MIKNKNLMLALVLLTASLLNSCAEREVKAELPKENKETSVKSASSEMPSTPQEKAPNKTAEQNSVQAATATVNDFTGTTEAHRKTMVAPKFSGIIEKVLVKEGERVKKGTTLVMLDSADIVLQKRQAEAALVAANVQFESAQLDYDRSKSLREQNAIPQNQFELIDAKYKLAKTGVEQATVGLELAQNRLDDCKIPAPYNGIITKRLVSEGEYVTSMPPTSMLRIEDDETIALRVHIPEVYLTKVKIGDEVLIYFSAMKKEVKARVSRIINSVDTKTRNFSIIIEIENGDHSLWPGLFAQVKFTKPDIN